MLEAVLHKEQSLCGCDIRVLIDLNDDFVILGHVFGWQKKIYSMEQEILSYFVAK